MKRAWIWVVVATFVCVSGLAVADEKPSGTVSMDSKSVALGVGVNWAMASSSSRARRTRSASRG